MKIKLGQWERKGRYVIGTLSLLLLVGVLGVKFMAVHVLPVVMKSMPAPRIEVGAGYKVKLGNQVAQVFGDDDGVCDGYPCKVLRAEPGTTKEVTLLIDGKPLKELWTFKSYADGMLIQRPNGEYVYAAK